MYTHITLHFFALKCKKYRKVECSDKGQTGRLLTKKVETATTTTGKNFELYIKQCIHTQYTPIPGQCSVHLRTIMSDLLVQTWGYMIRFTHLNMGVFLPPLPPNHPPHAEGTCTWKCIHTKIGVASCLNCLKSNWWPYIVLVMDTGLQDDGGSGTLDCGHLSAKYCLHFLRNTHIWEFFHLLLGGRSNHDQP